MKIQRRSLPILQSVGFLRPISKSEKEYRKLEKAGSNSGPRCCVNRFGGVDLSPMGQDASMRNDAE